MEKTSRQFHFIALAALCVLLVGLGGFFAWRHFSKTPEQIAREAVIDILCNTDVLKIMAESDAILEYAKSHHQTLTMADYAAQAKSLQGKLIAITKTVRTKSMASPRDSDALRTITSIDEKAQSAFIENTTLAIQNTCPGKAKDQSKIGQGVKAVLIILKHN